MFAHLHNHTQYSVLDGHGKIKDYVRAAASDGQQALAITDHGSLAGAISFYDECKHVGIKPLIGCELYVDIVLKDKQIPYHLTVIAANLQGYRDLVRVNTEAAKNFYYRPRITMKELLDNNLMKNWLVLTGCPSSAVNMMMRDDKLEEAVSILRALEAGSYQLGIEVMYHTASDQDFRQMQSDLLWAQFDLAEQTDVPLVLTNDCHYVAQADEEVHQAFLQATKGRVHGIEFDGEGFYLKTSEEMRSVAEYIKHPEAYENAQIFADMCELEIPELENPVWYVPSPVVDPLESIKDRYCHKMANELDKLEYWERLDYELKVIQTSIPIMNSYLVAADLIDFCKEQGIPATGRGSMAGSLISYLLGITSEDPVKYKLNFNRAVNPARLTIPDFDIDVSSSRRGEVLSYLAAKYPHSAAIGSYSERGIKGATKTVMSALNYTFEYANSVTKQQDEREGVDIEDNLEPVPEEIRDVVRGYVGLLGNMTVHPAGVLISGADKPLEGVVPMGYVASSKQMVTQFDMYSLKKINMFKLDVLGLATLDAMAMMEQLTGILPPEEYDDDEVFKILSKGLVCEIFQLDGFAARSAIRQLGISSFEDIVAINALVRPGAAQFISRYHTGDDTLSNVYPPISDVLMVTRGLILYQEQVMEICRILADFDDLEQDDIKEAIKYFRADVFAEIEPRFMQGCAKNGHDGAMIWASIKTFAGYAFNRAHAVTYAATAYKMAWYKKYYPEAFYTALYDKADNKIRLVLESLQLGVKWQLPSINHSDFATRFEQGKIVLGLSAIKGIGPAVAQTIVQARITPFADYEEFEALVPKKKCNVRHKQLLQDAGAMSCIGLASDPVKQTELLGFNPIVTDQEVAAQVTIWEHNRVGGFLASMKEYLPGPQSKLSGKRMGFLTIVNAAGEFEVTLFPNEWKKFKRAIKELPGMAPLIFHGYESDRGFVADGAEYVD